MASFRTVRIADDDPVLAQTGAEVWRVDLDAAREPPADAIEDLTEAERGRLARYRQVGDRARFACLRAALRRELGTRLGLPPRAVPIRIDPAGRPHLDGEPIRFSLAHSGEHGLIGLHATRRIGVDLEQLRPLDRIEAAARLILSPPEYGIWEAQPIEARLALLLRAWTAKEALLKAAGVGLASEPTSFRVLTETDDLAPHDPIAGLPFQSGDVVHALAVPPGYQAAVALLASPRDAA